MSCERNRSEIREVALGAAPSSGLESHLASCPECGGLLARERRRLAEIEHELGQALDVEPPPSLLPRVREAASRERTRAPWSRPAWLLPLAAALVAIAVVVPLARRMLPAPGSGPAPPSPEAVAAGPAASELERPVPTGRAQMQESARRQSGRAAATQGRGRVRTARAASEPEVIVPPGGEAALRRYVQAIRHSRVVAEVVRDVGPDAVDWTEPTSLRQQPRTVERFPAEMEARTAEADALTLSD